MFVFYDHLSIEIKSYLVATYNATFTSMRVQNFASSTTKPNSLQLNFEILSLTLPLGRSLSLSRFIARLVEWLFNRSIKRQCIQLNCAKTLKKLRHWTEWLYIRGKLIIFAACTLLSRLLTLCITMRQHSRAARNNIKIFHHLLFFEFFLAFYSISSQYISVSVSSIQSFYRFCKSGTCFCSTDILLVVLHRKWYSFNLIYCLSR